LPKGNPIWFLNLANLSGIIVRTQAKLCGEFSVTNIWINGLITNYVSVFNTFLKLRNMAFKSYSAKIRKVYDIYKDWYFTRLTWPRATFISNVNSSYNAAKESYRLRIPCLGIVDTDTYTHVVSIPIPGNDESNDCMFFYNDLVSQFILSRKFLNIMLWYSSIRNGHRILDFHQWIIRKVKNIKDKYNNNLSSKVKLLMKYSPLKHIKWGMFSFFFYNNKFYMGKSEYSKAFNKNDFFMSSVYQQRTKSLNLFNSIFSSKHSFIKRIFKMYNKMNKLKCNYFIKFRRFNWKLFKKRFFRRYYYPKVFLKNFFKRRHISRRHRNDLFISRYFKFFLLYNFMKYKAIMRKKKPLRMFFYKNLLSTFSLSLVRFQFQSPKITWGIKKKV